jgi:prepilin-type N-terminal cleavage/methylation domain-containing protein
MRTSRDDGFTLVELLVVMVIAAALVAIAIPVFMTQKEKSYTTAMQSDLHSVVVAESSWSMDHLAPTSDTAELTLEGYSQTKGVSTPHVKVTAAAYVACVKHVNAKQWLVYDSITGKITQSDTDCV